MSSWFDWLERKPLQPFPLMADDPVRAQIDDAVVRALDLNADWVAQIRRGLSRDPSVAGRGAG